MTNKLPVAIKDVNLEIVAKIINSVALKYGCCVHYIPRENRVKFIGDQNCFQPIVEETMALFFQKQPTMVPVRAARNRNGSR